MIIVGKHQTVNDQANNDVVADLISLSQAHRLTRWFTGRAMRRRLETAADMILDVLHEQTAPTETMDVVGGPPPHSAE